MAQQTNMYTDGTYFKFNPDWGIKDSSWKAEKIHSLIKKNKLLIKDITDIGSGSGGVLYELSKRMPEVTQFRGYEISADALAIAKKYKNEKITFINADFNTLTIEKTDLLLLIDVLEHLEDYYTVMRSLLSKSEYFIFHIPLDLSCRTILKPHVLLQQRETVGHLHYFSKEMVLWLLKDIGYSIIDWHYTKPVGDENKPKSFRQGIKKILRNISFSLNKNLSDKLWGGYSMLILAQKQ